MFGLIKNIIDIFIKKEKVVLREKKDIELELINEMSSQLELLNKHDFKDINLPKLGTTDPFFTIKTSKTKLKNVLIVDDLEDIAVLYLRAFKAIKLTSTKKGEERNVYNDFNVYSTFESNCGAVAFNFITKNQIDFAILDITLGYLTNLDNGKYVTIDGVDLAVEIWRRYPECKIVFSTVHTCNQKNPTINKYFTKFNVLTNKNLEDYYIEKNSEYLYESLEKFLYE